MVIELMLDSNWSTNQIIRKFVPELFHDRDFYSFYVRNFVFVYVYDVDLPKEICQAESKRPTSIKVCDPKMAVPTWPD